MNNKQTAPLVMTALSPAVIGCHLLSSWIIRCPALSEGRYQTGTEGRYQTGTEGRYQTGTEGQGSELRRGHGTPMDFHRCAPNAPCRIQQSWTRSA